MLAVGLRTHPPAHPPAHPPTPMHRLWCCSAGSRCWGLPSVRRLVWPPRTGCRASSGGVWGCWGGVGYLWGRWKERESLAENFTAYHLDRVYSHPLTHSHVHTAYPPKTLSLLALQQRSHS